MCDIWFIPMITLYVKAFVKPFLFDMTPAQAHEMIQKELPHQKMSNALLTKGVINLMPEKVQSFMKNNMEGEQIDSAESHSTIEDSDRNEMRVRPGPMPT